MVCRSLSLLKSGEGLVVLSSCFDHVLCPLSRESPLARTRLSLTMFRSYLQPCFVPTPQGEGPWNKAFLDHVSFSATVSLFSSCSFLWRSCLLFASRSEHTPLWTLTSTMWHGWSDWASFGWGQWRMEVISYNSCVRFPSRLWCSVLCGWWWEYGNLL